MRILIVLIGLCLTNGVVIAAAPGQTSQSEKRIVFLEIAVPIEGAKPVQVSTYEADHATIAFDGRKCGFEPSVRDDDRSMVVVTVLELGDSRRDLLGQSEVQVGGASVRSETTPSFGIRVLRVSKAA
jgi:hypothetical protein